MCKVSVRNKWDPLSAARPKSTRALTERRLLAKAEPWWERSKVGRGEE